MEELGVFSLADAKQIHAKCIGGKLLEAKEHTQPRGKAGGGAILAVTPVGGIAARTDNTLPITFPSALCYKINADTGDYDTPAEEVEVCNMTNVPISAQSLIQAKKIGNRWFVDVDNCSGSNISLPTVTAPGP